MEEKNNTFIPTLLIALLAAIVGTIIWAIIGISFRSEIAIIAWALGFMSGYAVGMVAKKNVHALHQIMAVVSVLIAIIFGKYATFAYTYKGNTIGGIFDPHSVTVFNKNLSLFFGGFDIIFILLAVVTAWQVPLQFKKDDEEDKNDPENEQINQNN